ncbi:DHHA1 domain-containing protein [Sphingobium sp. LSP13-1-1.1]|uniref:DHHA1 domain-containing protein n=1 Tax=Sphingobium sp. LSP13-1-1.1 TaxID=3135234 RepID=UPI00343DFB57
MTADFIKGAAAELDRRARNQGASAAMTWKPDIVIYHSPCDDGFGAAWAASKRWGDEPQYLPTNYGIPAPDVSRLNVLIVDFSYKRAELDVMAQTAASIVILDHHKTALAELEAFRFIESSPGAVSADDIDGTLRDCAELDRPPVIAVFDMERSGARMTWDFCHPDTPAPRLIELIEDRDLWRFSIPETRAFSLLLRAHPDDFQAWNEIADQVQNSFGLMQFRAKGIEQFYDRRIDRMLKGKRWTSIGGYTVPTVNCPSDFSSDVGHALLKLHPEAPFAACYCDGNDRRGYSLRSDDERVDVSEIARKLGGGGHRNAAGFGVPLP